MQYNDNVVKIKDQDIKEAEDMSQVLEFYNQNNQAHNSWIKFIYY